MARSRSSDVIDGPGGAAGSNRRPCGVSSASEAVTCAVRTALLRRWSRHWFVASRYSHVPSADCPLKLPSLRCASRKISYSRSSASAAFPSIR